MNGCSVRGDIPVELRADGEEVDWQRGPSEPVRQSGALFSQLGAIAQDVETSQAVGPGDQVLVNGGRVGQAGRSHPGAGGRRNVTAGSQQQHKLGRAEHQVIVAIVAGR